MSTDRIRLAEQALASHRQKLATAADKDQVRRQIVAAEARLRDLKTEDDIVECAGCGTPTGPLEVFPGELCIACWVKTPEGRRMPTADDVRAMWGTQPRRRSRA